MDAQHVPALRDSPDAPEEITKVNHYRPNDRNRVNGYRLWFRVRVERVELAEAWRGVFPDSKSRGHSAEVQASRFLKWYEETYPPTFDQVANALGLSPYFIMKNLRLMMRATIWEWDAEANRKVDTRRPDLKMRVLGHRELVKLVEKSEKWRKEFLEQEANRPPQFDLPPEHATVEQWEEWAKRQDVLGDIERGRKEATEARNRRLQEEGRQLPPPRVNGAHT